MDWMLPGMWDAAGVGSPGSFSGGQRATSLGRFLGQQPAGVGGAEQADLDVSAVEDAAGDQAVEADPGLVEGVVAAALGGMGDLDEFLLEGGLAVGMAGGSRLEPGRRGRRRWVGSGRAEQAAQR